MRTILFCSHVTVKIKGDSTCKRFSSGTSLVFQQPRLWAPNTGGWKSILGPRTGSCKLQLRSGTTKKKKKRLKKESEVSQSCPALCYPLDCSPPGSSIHRIFQARVQEWVAICSLPGFPVHGIFLARVLEWVTISFSRGSSRPRDWTQVSRIVGRCFTIWATREVQVDKKGLA